MPWRCCPSVGGVGDGDGRRVGRDRGEGRSRSAVFGPRWWLSIRVDGGDGLPLLATPWPCLGFVAAGAGRSLRAGPPVVLWTAIATSALAASFGVFPVMVLTIGLLGAAGGARHA